MEGFQQAQDFAHAHGDMVSVMFIGGIPWPEALEGQPFLRDVESNVLLSHSQSKWDQLKDLHRVT